MQIMAPDYYKKFKCIAGDCKHSCCVGWEIDIDSDTLEIYNNIKGAWGEKLKKAISYDGDAPHFITDSNDRCPFLNKEGLFNLFKNREIPLKQTMQRVADEYNVIFDIDISSLVNTCRNLERLDPEWDEYLNKTEQKSLDFNYILSLAERKIPLQARNLLCYFTYRYFATEILGNNQQGAVKFMLQSTYFCLAVALSSCDDLNAKSFANVVRLFSSETEYSEENIRLLLN